MLQVQRAREKVWQTRCIKRWLYINVHTTWSFSFIVIIPPLVKCRSQIQTSPHHSSWHQLFSLLCILHYIVKKKNHIPLVQSWLSDAVVHGEIRGQRNEDTVHLCCLPDVRAMEAVPQHCVTLCQVIPWLTWHTGPEVVYPPTSPIHFVLWAEASRMLMKPDHLAVCSACCLTKLLICDVSEKQAGAKKKDEKWH